MKFFSISKDSQSAVYVLNNNLEVGVILDIDKQTYQEKIKLCLDQDTGYRYTTEKVLGKDCQQGLKQIPDEWE